MRGHTTPKEALAELLAQHARLRDMIARCEWLADQLEGGEGSAEALLSEVEQLRIAFDVHNQHEERLLHPGRLPSDASRPGSTLGSREIEDHIEEHRAMRRELGSTASSELRSVLDSLRDHLDSEQHYFVAMHAVADEVVW